MVGQGDLAKKVPTPGLSCVDWKAVEKPWHVVRLERERDKSGPKARRRLGELWEEGKKGRGDIGTASGDRLVKSDREESEFGLI